jgi:hypothetical protein
MANPTAADVNWSLVGEIERLRTTIEHQAASLAAKNAEIARLRAVVSDCAEAIGNGAGVAPSSSIEFIELLPGEIAKYTDKLRRFLKCARDEGAEALDRAEQAERALAEAKDDVSRLHSEKMHNYERAIASDLRAEKLSGALAEAVEVLRPFVRNEVDGALMMTRSHVQEAVAAARAFVAQHGSDSSKEGKS